MLFIYIGMYLHFKLNFIKLHFTSKVSIILIFECDFHIIDMDEHLCERLTVSIIFFYLFTNLFLQFF